MRGPVIVIEDYPPLRRALAETLDDLGYEVETFAAARPALDRLAEVGVSVVVTDLHLPGNGVTLLQELRCRRRGAVPVVLMTSDHRLETRQTALDNGAFAVLPKPVDRATLERALESALSGLERPGESGES